MSSPDKLKVVQFPEVRDRSCNMTHLTMQQLLVCVAVALVGVVQGAVDGDLVTEIPGLATPFDQRIWSGYIEVPTVNGSANVHYVLVENGANKTDAPTLVWQQGSYAVMVLLCAQLQTETLFASLSGGPGGSSLIGLFTEVHKTTSVRSQVLQPD